MGLLENTEAVDYWNRGIYIELSDDRIEINVHGLQQRGIVLRYKDIAKLKQSLEDAHFIHKIETDQ